MATTVRTKLKCSGPYLWVYKKKKKKKVFECLSVVYIVLHVYKVLVHCIDYYIVQLFLCTYDTLQHHELVIFSQGLSLRMMIVELSNGTLNVRRKTRFISLLDIIMSAQYATNMSENDNSSQFHPDHKTHSITQQWNERKDWPHLCLLGVGFCCADLIFGSWNKERKKTLNKMCKKLTHSQHK